LLVDQYLAEESRMMRTAMFVLAAVAPGLASRAPYAVPHPMGPQADLLSTLAILVIGLLLIGGAIRAVLKQ
jgi:hypothetical protein